MHRSFDLVQIVRPVRMSQSKSGTCVYASDAWAFNSGGDFAYTFDAPDDYYTMVLK